MGVEREISRIAKLLVETKQITLEAAQQWLRSLTLEIVVAPGASSPAAHAAVLTAVLVGSRTFVGGVRVVGATEQVLNSSLPLSATTLGAAAEEVGATKFAAAALRQIVIGHPDQEILEWAVSPWWAGWNAGTSSPGQMTCDKGDNPLVGIAAAALAVGIAFDAVRGIGRPIQSAIDLWPVAEGEHPPSFSEIYLPGALWLIGLGNLGQAFLWALASLPYSDPSKVNLVLQDRDTVKEENWGTSGLVRKEAYGELKTKIAEDWARAKGFGVRRIDRRLLAGDRLEYDDPRIALSGVDSVDVRKGMGEVGFECIVDAGLGRTAANFDQYRVTVCDHNHPIDKHFATPAKEPGPVNVTADPTYQRLEVELGSCGAAEFAGASIAAPYVSAIAAAVAVSRLIAVTSGCSYPISESRKLSAPVRRRPNSQAKSDARGAGNAGRPDVQR